MRKPSVRKYGSRAILMEWEKLISTEINDEVVATVAFLNQHHSDWILEIVPSYQSLVIFLKENADLEKYIDMCKEVDGPISLQVENQKTWHIPACYDPSFGPDLESISTSQNLSAEAIIQLHTARNYRIYGIGFLPGFLYLGGLDEKIHTPRKRTINRAVAKGSVAIGGQQTGIYPQESPGGWNIIGRTPIELFDSNKLNPTPFTVGDSIRFNSINREEYDQIEQEIILGTYQLTTFAND